ncbi:unnamed protein product [Amoebophrya sp. A25]|nr:unnamed protein product [Amoebophrya sp. A25]|eukprot:GSA25T00024569001.1
MNGAALVTGPAGGKGRVLQTSGCSPEGSDEEQLRADLLGMRDLSQLSPRQQRRLLSSRDRRERNLSLGFGGFEKSPIVNDPRQGQQSSLMKMSRGTIKEQEHPGSKHLDQATVPARVHSGLPARRGSTPSTSRRPVGMAGSQSETRVATTGGGGAASSAAAPAPLQQALSPLLQSRSIDPEDLLQRSGAILSEGEVAEVAEARALAQIPRRTNTENKDPAAQIATFGDPFHPSDATVRHPVAPRVVNVVMKPVPFRHDSWGGDVLVSRPDTAEAGLSILGGGATSTTRSLESRGGMRPHISSAVAAGAVENHELDPLLHQHQSSSTTTAMDKNQQGLDGGVSLALIPGSCLKIADTLTSIMIQPAKEKHSPGSIDMLSANLSSSLQLQQASLMSLGRCPEQDETVPALDSSLPQQQNTSLLTASGEESIATLQEDVIIQNAALQPSWTGRGQQRIASPVDVDNQGGASLASRPSVGSVKNINVEVVYEENNNHVLPREGRSPARSPSPAGPNRQHYGASPERALSSPSRRIFLTNMVAVCGDPNMDRTQQLLDKAAAGLTSVAPIKESQRKRLAVLASGSPRSSGLVPLMSPSPLATRNHITADHAGAVGGIGSSLSPSDSNHMTAALRTKSMEPSVPISPPKVTVKYPPVRVKRRLLRQEFAPATTPGQAGDVRGPLDIREVFVYDHSPRSPEKSILDALSADLQEKGWRAGTSPRRATKPGEEVSVAAFEQPVNEARAESLERLHRGEPSRIGKRGTREVVDPKLLHHSPMKFPPHAMSPPKGAPFGLSSVVPLHAQGSSTAGGDAFLRPYTAPELHVETTNFSQQGGEVLAVGGEGVAGTTASGLALEAQQHLAQGGSSLSRSSTRNIREEVLQQELIVPANAFYAAHQPPKSAPDGGVAVAGPRSLLARRGRGIFATSEHVVDHFPPAAGPHFQMDLRSLSLNTRRLTREQEEEIEAVERAARDQQLHDEIINMLEHQPRMRMRKNGTLCRPGSRAWLARPDDEPLPNAIVPSRSPSPPLAEESRSPEKRPATTGVHQQSQPAGPLGSTRSGTATHFRSNLSLLNSNKAEAPPPPTPLPPHVLNRSFVSTPAAKRPVTQGSASGGPFSIGPGGPGGNSPGGQFGGNSLNTIGTGDGVAGGAQLLGRQSGGNATTVYNKAFLKVRKSSVQSLDYKLRHALEKSKIPLADYRRFRAFVSRGTLQLRERSAYELSTIEKFQFENQQAGHHGGRGVDISNNGGGVDASTSPSRGGGYRTILESRGRDQRPLLGARTTEHVGLSGQHDILGVDVLASGGGRGQRSSGGQNTVEHHDLLLQAGDEPSWPLASPRREVPFGFSGSTMSAEFLSETGLRSTTTDPGLLSGSLSPTDGTDEKKKKKKKKRSSHRSPSSTSTKIIHGTGSGGAAQHLQQHLLNKIGGSPGAQQGRNQEGASLSSHSKDLAKKHKKRKTATTGDQHAKNSGNRAKRPLEGLGEVAPPGLEELYCYNSSSPSPSPSPNDRKHASATSARLEENPGGGALQTSSSNRGPLQHNSKYQIEQNQSVSNLFTSIEDFPSVQLPLQKEGAASS